MSFKRPTKRYNPVLDCAKFGAANIKLIIQIGAARENNI
jgi:hypothetical protein